MTWTFKCAHNRSNSILFSQKDTIIAFRSYFFNLEDDNQDKTVDVIMQNL